MQLQKFDNRKSVILNEEIKYWNDLSLEFMTEESDDEDDRNCIIEHKLPWRSTGMYNIVYVTRGNPKYLQI